MFYLVIPTDHLLCYSNTTARMGGSETPQASRCNASILHHEYGNVDQYVAGR